MRAAATAGTTASSGRNAAPATVTAATQERNTSRRSVPPPRYGSAISMGTSSPNAARVAVNGWRNAATTMTMKTTTAAGETIDATERRTSRRRGYATSQAVSTPSRIAVANHRGLPAARAAAASTAPPARQAKMSRSRKRRTCSRWVASSGLTSDPRTSSALGVVSRTRRPDPSSPGRPCRRAAAGHRPSEPGRVTRRVSTVPPALAPNTGPTDMREAPEARPPEHGDSREPGPPCRSGPSVGDATGPAPVVTRASGTWGGVRGVRPGIARAGPRAAPRAALVPRSEGGRPGPHRRAGPIDAGCAASGLLTARPGVRAAAAGPTREVSCRSSPRPRPAPRNRAGFPNR